MELGTLIGNTTRYWDFNYTSPLNDPRKVKETEGYPILQKQNKI